MRAAAPISNAPAAAADVPLTAAAAAAAATNAVAAIDGSPNAKENSTEDVGVRVVPSLLPWTPTPPPSGPGSADEAEARLIEARVLALEVLCEVALRNRDRAACFWPAVHDTLASLLGSTRTPVLLAVRASLEAVRLCARLLPRDGGAANLGYVTLELLLSTPHGNALVMSAGANGALLRLMAQAAQHMRKSGRGWRVLCAVAAAPALGSLREALLLPALQV
ncbi:hypothetical protein T492DRAFT_387609 [Pavlovales sp. CCMP2436]|nr:hypothetical protein T492DRAFT_387609 [Pavlovales sp. CCMP2436]